MGSQRRYEDFDLVIEQAEGGGYRARVAESPAGEASSDFELPFSDLELENFLLKVGRPRRGTRRLESPEMAAARDFGGRLFTAVFKDDVRLCLRRSLDETERSGEGLRIRLRLNDAPGLVNIPWEYLFNESADRFLVLSTWTPIVRYPDMPQTIRPLAIEPPLRILALVSSPSDYPTLDVTEEASRIRNALSGLIDAGSVDIDVLEDATLIDLQRQLRTSTYHVLHFIGHGGFDKSADDGVLVLEDGAGKSRVVSGRDLGTILADHRSLRLAVLNACDGARASSADPFAGSAQSLIKQGLPAVVAMQFEITDGAAIAFAHEFYGALAEGSPVDAAVAEGRRAIFGLGNDIEWGTPVLYMRSPDGILFDVTAPVKPTAEPIGAGAAAALIDEAEATAGGAGATEVIAAGEEPGAAEQVVEAEATKEDAGGGAGGAGATEVIAAGEEEATKEDAGGGAGRVGGPGATEVIAAGEEEATKEVAGGGADGAGATEVIAAGEEEATKEDAGVTAGGARATDVIAAGEEDAGVTADGARATDVIAAGEEDAGVTADGAGATDVIAAGEEEATKAAKTGDGRIEADRETVRTADTTASTAEETAGVGATAPKGEVTAPPPKPSPPKPPWAWIGAGVGVVAAIGLGIALFGGDGGDTTTTTTVTTSDTTTVTSEETSTTGGNIDFAEPGDARAIIFDASPTIDGAGSEWTTAPVHETPELVFRSPSIQNGSIARLGTNGTAEIKLGWDVDNLYVFAAVRDDVVSQPNSGNQIWRGDAITLNIALNGGRGNASENPDADDFQVTLSPGDPLAGTSAASVIFNGVGGGFGNDRTGLADVAATFPGGEFAYTLEARVPWGALGVDDPSDLDEIGMLVALFDNDGEQEADGARSLQAIILGNTPDAVFQGPQSWGFLTLEP